MRSKLVIVDYQVGVKNIPHLESMITQYQCLKIVLFVQIIHNFPIMINLAENQNRFPQIEC